MQSKTLQFIAQTKLRELRQQRSLLIDAYDRLTSEIANLPPAEKLQKTYLALRKIECARRKCHPDVENLEILFSDTAPSVEVIRFWQDRLDHELSWGRLRAEIVFLFGALLGEWEKRPEESERFRKERGEAIEGIIEHATADQTQADDWVALLPDDFRSAQDRIEVSVAEKWQEVLGTSESSSYLCRNLKDNIYQPATLRSEAKRLAENAILMQEFATAIGLSSRDPDSWNWPGEGVAFQVLWTRNKWRLYLRQSLPEIGILESYGNALDKFFDGVYCDLPQSMARRSMIQKLIACEGPSVVIDNERRMLREIEARVYFEWYEPVDPWTGVAPSEIPDGSDGGIVATRAVHQASLRQSGSVGYYGGYGASSPQLQLTHAEVRTLRAAYPELPLYVLKVDIQDYYPSIPHDAIATMLRHFRFPISAINFCERFLKVPLNTERGIVIAKGGVPMDHAISSFLAEKLMLLLEQHIHRRARVRILRLIDDICVLSSSATEIENAYRAIQEFLLVCRLGLNEEKSGSLAIGAALPASLPQQAPRWGLLELRSDGSWGVHEASFVAHWAQARERIQATHSILERVSRYNAELRFLTSALGIDLDLGDAHRAAINHAMRRFSCEFFEPGCGIVEGLRRAIEERYPSDARMGTLPESWFYWPVTAGGLSLRNPTVLMGQYNEAFEIRKKNRIPVPLERSADWQFDKMWIGFYGDLFEKLSPKGPKETTVMKTLVEDFIQRGSEITAGKQKTLSDYWRWILVVYGPEILEKFGTFRFLITELVPLQLIHERLLSDSSLEPINKT